MATQSRLQAAVGISKSPSLLLESSQNFREQNGQDEGISLGQQYAQRLVWIEFARVVGAVAVIVLHCAGAVMENAGSSAEWTAGNVFNAGVRWSVPLFVLVSGFVLLDLAKETPVFEFYMHRLLPLLRITAFWTIVYIAFAFLSGRPTTIWQVIGAVAAGKPYYHLWYLYMLFGLYAVTPFLRKLIFACSPVEQFVLCVLCLLFAVGSASQMIVPAFSSIYFVGTFIAGHILGSLIFLSKKAAAACLAAGYLVTVIFSQGFHMLGYGGLRFTHSFASPNVLIMAFGIFSWLRTFTVPFYLAPAVLHIGRATLGIYVIHAVVLELLQNSAVSPMELGMFIGIPLQSLIVFVLSYSLTVLMQRLPVLRLFVTLA